MNNYLIKVSPPEIDDVVMQRFFVALEKNMVNGGASIDKFEKGMSEILEGRHVLAMNSGTSALYMALLLLNVQDGDEVICPTFTFAATANAIIYLNAKPVFVDSEEDTWNICPVLLKMAIEDGTLRGKIPKAIIIGHNYGTPAKLAEICTISQEFKIPLVEDAAGALGATYNGRMVGSFGKFGIFSFNYNKIITTTGGGLLVSDDEELIKKAKYFSSQAKAGKPYYEHHDIGYNFRMSGMAAELGVQQIPLLKNRLKRKSEIYNNYVHTLKGIQGIKFVQEDNGATSNYFISNLLINDKIFRDRLMHKLQDNLIETKYLWNPLHLQPVFLNYRQYLNGFSEKLFNSGISLPSGSGLLKKDQKKVTDGILDFLLKLK